MKHTGDCFHGAWLKPPKAAVWGHTHHVRWETAFQLWIPLCLLCSVSGPNSSLWYRVAYTMNSSITSSCVSWSISSLKEISHRLNMDCMSEMHWHIFVGMFCVRNPFMVTSQIASSYEAISSVGRLTGIWRTSILSCLCRLMPWPPAKSVLSLLLIYWHYRCVIL